MKIASNHSIKNILQMTLRREFIVRHRNFCVHKNGKALQIQSTFRGARIKFIFCLRKSERLNLLPNLQIKMEYNEAIEVSNFKEVK